MRDDGLTSAADGGALDAGELRTTFGRVPAGVVAVAGTSGAGTSDAGSAADAGGRGLLGLVASTFVGVSLDPPLVSFCVQWTSTTWPLLEPLPRLGISVLGSEQEPLARQVAGRGDRFAGVEPVVTGGGAVLLPGATAWLEASVHQVVPAGDHGIVVMRVHALRTFGGVEPLVFHGSAFRALLP